MGEKLTFFISPFDDKDMRAIFAAILTQAGWQEVKTFEETDKFPKDINNPRALTLVYGLMGFTELYGINAKIKNFIGTVKRCIINKCNLSINMTGRGPISISSSDEKLMKSHFPAFDFLHNVTEIKPGDIKIAKPCGKNFNSGRGIYIITSTAELNNVKRVYPKHKMTHWDSKEEGAFTDVLLCEYINYPLTYNGLKMHLRMYLLVCLEPNLSFSVFKNGKILTAKLPYSLYEYNNMSIHDTHEKSTKEFYSFREDYRNFDGDLTSEKIDEIWNQINEVCRVVFNVLAAAFIKNPEQKIYNKKENKTAFEVFGIDFMVDKYNVVKLIEVNDRTGYDYSGSREYYPKYLAFIKEYYLWLYENAIKPLEGKAAEL